MRNLQALAETRLAHPAVLLLVVRRPDGRGNVPRVQDGVREVLGRNPGDLKTLRHELSGHARKKRRERKKMMAKDSKDFRVVFSLIDAIILISGRSTSMEMEAIHAVAVETSNKLLYLTEEEKEPECPKKS